MFYLIFVFVKKNDVRLGYTNYPRATDVILDEFKTEEEVKNFIDILNQTCDKPASEFAR